MIKIDDRTEIKVKAKKILLATGGHPTVPRGIPGAEYGIDSDGFFELDQQPKKVAIAISQTPEVKGLGLDVVGVKQNERGQIITDEYQNTNVENIYSLGDIVGKFELTPVAIAAGRKLSDRLFGGEKFNTSKLDYNLIPSVVFAHPEVGTIGLT
ncbi:hypothetical protein H9Q69_012418 [Fusarium xylarioides]|nr:hypothetical protein H9Q69_012418 [Fusarium xylarioides]